MMTVPGRSNKRPIDETVHLSHSVVVMRKLIYCQYVVGITLFLYGGLSPSFEHFDWEIAGAIIVYLTIAEHILYRLLHRRRK
jgi:hypothetical protein